MKAVCLTPSQSWIIWQKEDIKYCLVRPRFANRRWHTWDSNWNKAIKSLMANWKQDIATTTISENWMIPRDCRVVLNLYTDSKTIVSFFDRTRLWIFWMDKRLWGGILHLEGKTCFGSCIRIAQFTEKFQIIHSWKARNHTGGTTWDFGK